MDDNVRLSCYKESLKTAWGYNDYNDWPIKVNSVFHIFLPDFTTEFLTDLHEAKERNIPTEDIARAFSNPARFYRLINPVIFGMKRLRMDIHEQRRIVIDLLDIVKKMKYGSEFNEEGVNTILSPDQLAQLFSRIDLKKADRETAAIIQRFCGIMWAYTEAIFFRAHEVTKEIHGPYIQGDSGEKFLIREYLHLHPREIWGDIPMIPCQKIVIYTKYLELLDVTIDSYNHLFLNSGNYVDHLLEYAVEINGEPAPVEELIEIMPLMQQTIQTVHGWVSKSDWFTKVNRYADIYWYRKSPLRKLLGKDWRVPQTVREKIMCGEPDPKKLHNLSSESIDRLISIII